MVQSIIETTGTYKGHPIDFTIPELVGTIYLLSEAEITGARENLRFLLNKQLELQLQIREASRAVVLASKTFSNYQHELRVRGIKIQYQNGEITSN